MEAKWIRTTRRAPCPICERPDYCAVATTGEVVLCMRTPSAKPIKFKSGETGYLHRLTDPKPPPPPKRAPKPYTGDWTDFAKQCSERIGKDTLARLSLELGVSVASLQRMRTGWSAEHQAITFPMRTAQRKIIGIRLRDWRGAKWAVTGSRQGLFVPAGILDGLVLICEGPTDACAGLDLGFTTIGRPSCSACVRETVELCKGRDVVICGDNDDAKIRLDGSRYWPGQDGAHKLADALCGACRSVKLIWPAKTKDLRGWLKAGCTPADLQKAIARAKNIA